MKISFLVPTKDGGEGFSELIKSLKSNVNYAHEQGYNFEYDVTLIINGNPQKPLSYIKSSKDIINFIKIKEVNFLGKTKSINYCLKNNTSDIIVILDDDIRFEQKLLLLALNDLSLNKQLKLVSFQNRALPYSGHNLLERFSYDIINIRSLKRLYVGIDPFLFGRFLVAKKEAMVIPDNIINEDLYLSLIHKEHYLIRPEEVFYMGECSIWLHIKRVLRIEAGRNQIKALFGPVYNEIASKTKREINLIKLKNLSVYYKISYYCYCILRFVTNSLVARLFKPRISHW